MPVSEKTLQLLSDLTSSLSLVVPLNAVIKSRPGSIKAPPFLYSAIPELYRKEMERTEASTTTTTATAILPNDRKLIVHVISYSTKSEDDIEMAAMWPLIFRWFAFAFSQTPDSRCTAAGLQVFIYLTNYKKRLPSSKNITRKRKTTAASPSPPPPTLDYRHVNTAVTTTCPHTVHDNTIVVFRKEEWLRALIHETIHFMGWDFSGDVNAVSQADRVILRDMWRGLPASHNLFIFESFCDTWATIFQVLLLDMNNRKNTIMLLDKERRHSMGQCRKVMAHLGLTWSDLETPQSAAAEYREKTPILSYYVLKSVCMYFIDEFVSLFSTSRMQPFHFPGSHMRKESLRRYLGFLIRGLRDPKFKKSQTIDSGNSMRMSVTGF